MAADLGCWEKELAMASSSAGPRNKAHRVGACAWPISKNLTIMGPLPPCLHVRKIPGVQRDARHFCRVIDRSCPGGLRKPDRAVLDPKRIIGARPSSSFSTTSDPDKPLELYAIAGLQQGEAHEGHHQGSHGSCSRAPSGGWLQLPRL